MGNVTRLDVTTNQTHTGVYRELLLQSPRQTFAHQIMRKQTTMEGGATHLSSILT